MAEGDDFNLDLSYMDGDNGDAQQQQQQDGDYNYDDSAELYGDEGYGQDESTNHNDANGNANAKTDGSATNGTGNTTGNQDDNAGADTSSSRKRKARDDDDEYSETAQNVTPRHTSATPGPSQHGGYGPQPTHALDIKQLGHNLSEETIREWANAVGKEADIEELKFDEFKPNGKSKGYVSPSPSIPDV